MNLTDKQKKFAEVYLRTNSIAEATEQSGYSPTGLSTADFNRAKENDLVGNYIKRRQKELYAQETVTPEWVLRRLKMVVKKSLPLKGRPELFYTPRDGINALKHIIEMLGYRAPEKTVNYNFDVSLENIRNARLEYKKEY